MFDGIANRAADALHIPMQVIPGEPEISVSGRKSVYIENYHRIECFREDEIRLRARTCRIVIRGKRLNIPYYTKEEMLVSGQITAVELEGG